MSATPSLPRPLLNILDRLACPHCSGSLTAGTDALSCGGCGKDFPVENEIALLDRSGTAESWTDEEEAQTSRAYQEQYRDAEAAAEYNREYRDFTLKRMSTGREFSLLKSLLGSQERCETLLDVPCGGGRLSPAMRPFADTLIEADIGRGQLETLRQAQPPEAVSVWMTASAFHLPFKNESVDAAVCVRLNHHLPTEAERERLIEELLRVSRRFVLMTFFDYYSLKNTLRRVRRPFNHKPPKMTMTVARVEELARLNGARLVARPALSPVGSGHRYALMVKG